LAIGNEIGAKAEARNHHIRGQISFAFAAHLVSPCEWPVAIR
jgi:hypothetical protein